MTLIDTGPLVAIHDARDSFYGPCVALLSRFQPQRVATTWACFAEAMYLLGSAGRYRLQAELWGAWYSGLLELIDLSEDEIELSHHLMDRYQDHPMDLADATLVAVADFRGLHKVFTLDTHFHSFRLRDGSALDVILPSKD
jgi:predicted nucleic acid-binding protein